MSADRVSSPLASNNPFRNKIVPGGTSPVDNVARPVSRNPFLDTSEVTGSGTQQFTTNGTSSSSKGGATAKATELLVGTELQP